MIPAPHEVLAEKFKNADGEVDVAAMTAAMNATIEAEMPLPGQVLFSAAVTASEESMLFLADVLVASLAQLEVLPLGYEQTMLRIAAALENVRLRSLYNTVVTWVNQVEAEIEEASL